MLSPFFVLFYFLHGYCIFCRKLSVRKVTEYYREQNCADGSNTRVCLKEQTGVNADEE